MHFARLRYIARYTRHARRYALPPDALHGTCYALRATRYARPAMTARCTQHAARASHYALRATGYTL
eukprot:11198794-Lingulodinium_polyedra.AAC.1